MVETTKTVDNSKINYKQFKYKKFMKQLISSLGQDQKLTPNTLRAAEYLVPGTLHAGEDLDVGTLHAGEDFEPAQPPRFSSDR